MIQTIVKQTFGAAGSVPGSLTNHDVNRLLVSSTVPFAANDFLTVLLKSSKHEQKVLVNRVSMQALAEISDAESGQSPSLQGELVSLEAGTDWTGYALQVDLGCLKLRSTDSTVEILVEAAAACTMSVSAVFDKDDVDHWLATIQSSSLSDKADDVESVWLYNSAAVVNNPNAEDLSILIRSPIGATVCNASDAWAYTSTAKKVEAWAPKRTVCVYQNADRVTDVVSWLISGGSAANYKVITRSKCIDTTRVSYGTIAASSRLQQILAKKSPEQQQAYRRIGIDLRELRQRHDGLNIPGGN